MDNFEQLKKQFTAHMEQSKGSQIREEGPLYSKDGKWVYQISIIDYLQTFDSSKKREVIAKKIFKNADPTELSAVPPDIYGPRFLKFMKEYVFSSD